MIAAGGTVAEGIIDDVDPLGRPIGTAGSDNSTYVRTFQNQTKNKCQVKTIFTTCETVGLAEWIIDGTLCYLGKTIPQGQAPIMSAVLKGEINRTWTANPLDAWLEGIGTWNAAPEKSIIW